MTPGELAAVRGRLEEFAAEVFAPLDRRDQRDKGATYVRGLLLDGRRKSMQPMAERLGVDHQGLQQFVSSSTWAVEPVRERLARRAIEVIGPDAWVVDDTGFPKDGQASVGVARQYCGTLGKVGNCQVAVTCCYADARASWPVAVCLYLPQEWTEDPERLQRARVPDDVTFETKAQIALDLLDQARAWGVPHRGVTADADYGDNANFLAGLEARHERYVVAVRCDFQVRVKARGAPPYQRADQALAAVPRRQWRTIRWRHGTEGWLRKQFVALRAWRLTTEGEAYIGWLLGERASRGQAEEHKFYWSNLPASATLEELVEYAHRRHAIEQFHEEAKEELGWDQYQGRLWPGFHRHAVTVMLALSFLIWLELRERDKHPKRGRPRDPFSPSTGSLASSAA